MPSCASLAQIPSDPDEFLRSHMIIACLVIEHGKEQQPKKYYNR